MFSIGEQLYRLTARDEETLLVEQFFRSYTFTISGAATTGLVVDPIPLDRCLYIKRVIFSGFSFIAPGRWELAEVQLDARLAGALITVATRAAFDGGGLASDGTNRAFVPGTEIRQTYEVDTLYPPGMATIRLSAATAAKAVDASFNFQVQGYLLPPGRIGRR